MSEDATQSPLQRSLAELSTVLVGDQSIGDTLTRVARLAVESVPPALFAGITMIVDDQVSTRAFTDPASPEIDQAQYDSGHGPCLEAFRRSRTIVVDSLADDDRWPEFADAAMAHGVRSTLSLPLSAGDHAVGALNLYAGVERAFGETEVATGLEFATQASVVLVNAQAYWGARLLSEHLQTALEGREPIDLAKGIIMNATGCTPDEAFDVLVEQSQQENRKVRDIAAEIVADAQRRQQ
jgi:GAF domain-containing protein